MEMFGAVNSRRSRLISAARQAGFKYYAAAPAPPVFSPCAIDAGLLVISRFPIICWEFKPFQTVPVQSDVLAHKGNMYVKLDIRAIGG